MTCGIFISYRRSDDRHAAGRLHLHLREIFGAQQIFMDVSTIEPGHSFVQVLHEKIASCKVMLVLIGRGWLNNVERLKAPGDFVRMEIEAALKRKDVRIVPVLIDGLTMDQLPALPEPLQQLTDRQAWNLSHTSFETDVAGLIKTLAKDVPPLKWGLWATWFGNRAAGASSRRVPRPISVRQTAASDSAPQRLIRPVGRNSGWDRGIALAFAIGAAPIIFAVSITSMFLNQRLHVASHDRAIIAGFSIGALLLLVATLLRMKWRGASISGLERALYWVTMAIAVASIAGCILFNYVEKAALIWVPVIVVAATIFPLLSKTKRESGGEVVVYWVGCVTALFLIATGQVTEMTSRALFPWLPPRLAIQLHMVWAQSIAATIAVLLAAYVTFRRVPPIWKQEPWIYWLVSSLVLIAPFGPGLGPYTTTYVYICAALSATSTLIAVIGWRRSRL